MGPCQGFYSFHSEAKHVVFHQPDRNRTEMVGDATRRDVTWPCARVGGP